VTAVGLCRMPHSSGGWGVLRWCFVGGLIRLQLNIKQGKENADQMLSGLLLDLVTLLI
jgi:hypothetical protein